MNTWLWPDHVIGKRESRTLREEHNSLVNTNIELLQALKECLPFIKGQGSAHAYTAAKNAMDRKR